ncbi:MAG: molybdopterin-dependent oxidoreductase, partial [Caulobacteraceae bacterium]|nr:molybdopterin-dependent oxidoreductase [Caulobacter sp.]
MSGAMAGEGLVVHSQAPLNAEPSPERLAASWRTPPGAFYVRTHGDIPEADAIAWRLEVGGLVERRLSLSLADLERDFAFVELQAFMQCAGNRRADLQPVRPTGGDPWGAAAIGNALWGGVRLADVLRAAGVNEAAALHVAFTGRDVATKPEPDGGGLEPYAVSIPLSKAIAPETLLAWRMDGAPLRPEHGFPLRVVAPGYAGARSCKWLEQIEVRDTPSNGRFQARDYKMFPADVTEETADWSRGVTIDEMPVNSAVLVPSAFAELEAGETQVCGWAAASGRAVVRVDVSGDGGRTWTQAQLETDPAAPWAWTRWQAHIVLRTGEHQ